MRWRARIFVLENFQIDQLFSAIVSQLCLTTLFSNLGFTTLCNNICSTDVILEDNEWGHDFTNKKKKITSALNKNFQQVVTCYWRDKIYVNKFIDWLHIHLVKRKKSAFYIKVYVCTLCSPILRSRVNRKFSGRLACMPWAVTIPT